MTEHNLNTTASTANLTDVAATAVLPDGSVIDRLGDSQLILCQEGEIIVGRQIEHAGITYQAAHLDSTLWSLFKFPKAVTHWEPSELFAGLERVFSNEARLEGHAPTLLAAATLYTWVADMSASLCVNIIGACGTRARVSSLLASLARCPLPLTEFSIKELAQLPLVHPTVMVSDPASRSIRDVGLHAGQPGTRILRKGRIAPVPRFVPFVFSISPIALPSLRVNLFPRAGRFGSNLSLHALEEEFRPALLGFRLKHCRMGSPPTDTEKFSSGVQVVAESLATTLALCPVAQAAVLDALRLLDTTVKTSMLDSERGTVLEALFTWLHLEDKEPFVQQITKIANVYQVSRGEREFTSRAVGSILSEGLGLSSQRQGPGYRILLPREAKVRVHQLAKEFGLPGAPPQAGTCRLCDEAFGVAPSQARAEHSTSDPFNIHNLHDVHDGSHEIDLTSSKDGAGLEMNHPPSSEARP